jgi:general secretion pathway protein N
MILPGRVRTAAALGWRFAAVLVGAVAAGTMLTTPPERFGTPEPFAKPTTVRPVDKPVVDVAPRNVDYPAIAAYPLFYPTRTPWAPPPPAPPPPEVAAPSTLVPYTLVGVVVSGSTRNALVRGQAKKVVTLSEGQEIEGWTLKSITPERLYFSAGEATYEMTRRKPSEMQQ